MRQTKTYKAWLSMKTRCNKPHYHGSKHYYDRGITYDPAWESFVGFYADMGEAPAGTSLDRKDNDKGYSKDNCRWATPAQQSRNQTTTKLTEEAVAEIRLALNKRFGHGTKMKEIQRLADKFGVGPKTIETVHYCTRWAGIPQAER